STKSLLNGSNALARCLIHTVIPAGNQKIQDPPLTTGLRVYQELFQSSVGLAGTAQNLDGNGRYVRAAARGAGDPGQPGPLGGDGALDGNALLPTLGTRPAYKGKTPPIRGDVPCFKTSQPKLNAVKTGTGP